MKTNIKASVIIVNFNGKNFLKECLASVFSINFPQESFEVIMVDNDSKDNSTEFVKTNFPKVRIIESEKNLGFAGGCNLGVKNALGEFIVFLNTDTRVEKGWLKALVENIKPDKSVAAVNSKLLLYCPFFKLLIHSDIFMRSEFSNSVNFQSVGLLVESIVMEDHDSQCMIRYLDGFYEREKGIIPARWTKGDASVLIPVDPHKKEVKITITIRSEKSISGLETQLAIRLGNRDLITDRLKSYEVKQYQISLKTNQLKNHLLYAVQNAGVEVFKSGYGRDRGAIVRTTDQYYEIDNPFFNKRTELAAFTGASVIIRKSIFEKLGGFDERYFMYYEDVDLSLRMKRQGYKIMYEPKSVVYHIHSGSSKEWSGFFTYHVEKNYLATLIKHFPLNRVFAGFSRYISMWVISILKTAKWRISEHWELYDYWREKAEVRMEVLKWIVQYFVSFLISRYEINITQKKNMMEVYKKLS